MKKTLLSLAPVPVQQLKSLVQHSPGVPDIDVVDGHSMSPAELAKAFAKADAVLGDYTFRHRIGKELVANAGPLKLIQQPSVGYDNIDIKACSDRGIRVANAPTGNTVTVAEHTIAMGLALLRKLVHADRRPAAILDTLHRKIRLRQEDTRRRPDLKRAHLRVSEWRFLSYHNQAALSDKR
jgi:phosphoglycerate dehydrogenase-like enzyme